jgi:hypothetical protein
MNFLAFSGENPKMPFAEHPVFFRYAVSVTW